MFSTHPTNPKRRQIMTAKFHWMIAIVAGLLLTACGQAGVEDVPDTLGTLTTIEGATLGTTLDGEEIRLGAGALEGKAVILNYFNVA
jgi:hypothetical protein